jgi:hypothetical protein
MTRLKTHIKRITAAARARAAKVRDGVARRPRLFAGIAAGLVAITAGGYAVWQMDSTWNPVTAATNGLKGAAEVILPKKTLAELAQAVKESPKDTDALIALGHAQLEAGQRSNGVKSYQRALQLGAAPTDEMGEDLVTCYGKREQGQASALIRQHKMLAAIPKLQELVEAPSYQARWAAIDSLQALKSVKQTDYIAAWRKDLLERDCSVLQNAVENLGRHGDRSVLKDVKAAIQRDKKANDGFFEITCLGSRGTESEQQILARK